jgi:hypothetical protein
MTKTDGSGISNGMELPYEWEQFREHLERASAYPGASGCLGVVVLAEPDQERLFTQGKAVCPVSSAWRKAAKAAPDQTKLAVCSGPACLSSHEGVLRCWQYHFSVRGNEAFRDAFGDMLARAVRLTGRQKGAFLVNMADAVYREYPGEVCEDGLQVTYARRPSDARERNARLVRPREWVTMELRDPLGMVAMLLSSPSAQMVARVGGLNTAQGQAFLRIRTISNCLREWGTREELSSPALFGQIWAYGVHWLELIGREPVYPVPNSALVTVTEESGPPDWSKVSCDPDLLKVAQAEFRSFGALNNGEVFGLQAELSNLATWRTPLGQAEDCGRKVLEYWPESRRSNMADLLQQLAVSLHAGIPAEQSARRQPGNEIPSSKRPRVGGKILRRSQEDLHRRKVLELWDDAKAEDIPKKQFCSDLNDMRSKEHPEIIRKVTFGRQGELEKFLRWRNKRKQDGNW